MLKEHLMADDNEQDECLSEAEERRLAKLPAAIVTQIDQALLANATLKFRKVAYIVGVVMRSLRDIPYKIPDVYYAQRIAKLVDAGFLEAAGNLRRMRFSEVRLPSAPIATSDLEEMIVLGQYRQLAELYAEGQGVPQDYVEALKWYRMASEQGDIWAQLAVGRFYESGYGIQQDYAEAYFWYSLAANVSVDKYPFMASMDRIGPRLTPEEKAAVQKRVINWNPRLLPPNDEG
jgi:hypothetical protein